MRYRKSFFWIFLFWGSFLCAQTRDIQIEDSMPGTLDMSRIKGSLTRTANTNYYPDCPMGSDPLTLVEIPVPAYAMVENSTRSFFCVLDIMHMADLHDSTTDALIASGQYTLKIVFFCVNNVFYCIPLGGTELSFDYDTLRFTTAPLVRFAVPAYDVDNRVIIVGVQNSSGLDVFTNEQFTARGTLKNQVAFITYEDNGPQVPDPGETGDYYFSGDVLLTSHMNVSASRKLYFDGDARVDGNYNTIAFTRTPYPIVYLDEHVTATFENVVLQNFSPQHLSLEYTSTIIFGNGTTIELGRDETLTDTWLFEGACILKGNGQTFNLGPEGKIIIDKPGSSLLFDNITLAGLSDKNMYCLDNSCSFSFKKTKLVLADDFVMDTGFFDVLGSLKIVGEKKFTYATDQQSTIAANASVYLAKNGILEYAPPVADNTLIHMADSTSVLWLDNATLSVTTTGLRLENGRLTVANKSYLENAGAQSVSEAIAIKNIDILAGASLDVKSGILSVI